MLHVVRWLAGVAVLSAAATGCVDGTTPNCSTPDSGCYPVDAAGESGQADASDASSDVSEAGDDATTDAASD